MTVARLLLSCDHGLGKVLVEAISEPGDREMVQPLVRLLRRQPPWPGDGRFEIRVHHPAGLAAAFAPGALVTSADQLEDAAAVVWYAIDGGSVMLEWQRRTREALTDALRRRPYEQQVLPFGRAEL